MYAYVPIVNKDELTFTQWINVAFPMTAHYLTPYYIQVCFDLWHRNTDPKSITFAILGIR